MKTREDELIAMLLDDASPSPPVRRWLATDVGRRGLAEYRRTLSGLKQLYGDVTATPRPAAYYDSLQTPIGRVLVATTDAGLVRVSFRRSETSFAAELRERLGVAPVKAPAKTKAVVHQLADYFAGRRRSFNVPTDWRLVTPFQRRVLEATAEVPAGQVASYGDIAHMIGQPRGSRAVGQALGHNPMPIVIPCHRVLAAGGKLGGYTGGVAIKKKLLRLEGVVAANA
ncbi:MAG TPA: methylated-DNA--[protein]-cysteine S-methyltransferase [Candidatus Binatia bacterium]|nr:methylated-DNA--[protein]-cysteine S-methyltransferase [Candidatus Binatia bacterium]